MKIIFKTLCVLQFSLMMSAQIAELGEKRIQLTAFQAEKLSVAIGECRRDCSINNTDSYSMQRRHELALAAIRILKRDYTDECFGDSVFEDSANTIPALHFGKRFYYRDHKTGTVFMSWGSFKNGYVALSAEKSKVSKTKNQKIINTITGVYL